MIIIYNDYEKVKCPETAWKKYREEKIRFKKLDNATILKYFAYVNIFFQYFYLYEIICWKRFL